MKYLILILLMTSLVSAVDIKINCPDDIYVNEDFECSLKIINGDGIYDVKVEIDKERNSILRIWNDKEDSWQSGYYYLKEFIKKGEEKDIKLKVSEEGNYNGTLKLRQGSDIEFFDIKIEVKKSDGGNRENEEDDNYKKEDLKKKIEKIEITKEPEAVALNESKTREVISFSNGNSEKSLVYESNESKALNYLPYLFSLFLIFVIFLLIWNR